ncbi:AAA family ATPase, partial [Nocardia asteroides]|uniref:caspase, EACC1-associated type n=1 Tax=Nocardia asteroides TaxID=1824 RepID=UPI0037C8ADBB
MTDLSGAGVRVLILATAFHPAATLPDLPAVAASCRALREAFVHRCGVAERNMTIVSDAPDALSMARAITREAARAESVLLVYYLGHGLRGPGGELFLAASDTDEELDPGLATFQALSFDTVGKALQGCRAPSVVVILDCCFSGTARLDADTVSIREFATGTYGRYLIGSAEYLGLAPAGQRYTAFTGALLRLLEHGDPRAPAVLTLDAVFDGVHRLLRDSPGAPLPRRQAGDRAGGLVIAANPAAPTTGLPRRPPAPGRSPYPGLASFDPEDSGSFFGRDTMIERVMTALSATTGPGGPILLVGASGSGKTSLLNAGVIAAVRDRGLPGIDGSAGWPVRRCTPGTDPLQHLATALDAPGARHDLDRDPTHAGELAAGVLGGRAGQRLLLIVDQLEELFTLCQDPPTRTAFLTALTSLCAPGEDGVSRVSVLLALRADFYGYATTHPALAQTVRERQIPIEPITRDELREAIEKPATANGWILADGLTEVILADLGTDPAAAVSALPLLSHAMWSTWTRRDDITLTVAGYRDTGGITHAIKDSAETIYNGTDDAGRDALRLILPRLVRVGADGDADTAQPADRVGLTHGVPDPATATQILDELTVARLVSIDADTVRLSHEALLREWPRLREWIETDRDWLHRCQRFVTDSRDWHNNGREDSLLYRGPRLAAIRDRDIPPDQDPIHADPLATTYLTTALRAENRRALQRRAFTAVLLLLVIALAGVAVIAINQTREAEEQRRTAVARDLISRSQLLADTDPAASRLTALAAWRIHNSDEAGHAMRAAALNPFLTQITPDNGTISSTAFNLGRDILATTTTRSINSTSNSVELWDPVTGTKLRDLPTTDYINSMVFHPTRDILATSSSDGRLELWDPVTGTKLRDLPTNDSAGPMVFHPTRDILATSSSDGRLELWDPVTGTKLRDLPTNDSAGPM